MAVYPNFDRAYRVGPELNPGGLGPVSLDIFSTATDASIGEVVGYQPPTSFPTSVAISNPLPDGNQLAAITSSDGAVYIVQSYDDVINGPLQDYTGSVPISVEFRPDGVTGLVTNYGSNTVSVFDSGARRGIGTPIDWAGIQPFGLAISPDGLLAYVTNRGSNDVSVLEWVPASSNWRQVGVLDAAAAAFDDPYAVAFTPDGATAYVLNSGETSGGNGSISIVDVATGAVTGTVSGFSGTRPSAIAVHPSSDAAYVTNAGSNSVSVIDVATNAEVATVASFDGVTPTGIAITPDGMKAYVANMGDTQANPATAGSVSVIQVGPAPLAPGPALLGEISVASGQLSVPFTPGDAGAMPNTDYVLSVYVDGTTTPVATASWNAQNQPAAITATGLVDGQRYTATVTTENPARDVVSAMSAPVVVGLSPQFTNASPPSGTVGQFYSYTFTATGSPVPTLGVTTPLPTGLVLTFPAPGSMTLSGTPNAAWSGQFTVQAQNALLTTYVMPTITIANVGVEEPGPGPGSEEVPGPVPSASSTPVAAAGHASGGLPGTGGDVPVGAVFLGTGMLLVGGMLVGVRLARRRAIGRR